ncbi:MAG: BamA/TamA family outer membrane protein [Pseudomonadales bacterium]
MKFGSNELLACFVVATLLSTVALAKPPIKVKTSISRAENLNPDGQTLILPYAFSAESTGLVFGVGGMRKGFHQDQMSIGGLVFAGEESHAAFAGVWDYRLPFSQRTFVSTSGMYGYYPNHRAYTAPHDIYIPPGLERPGSNDSSEDVYIESAGYSNWMDITIEYALPIGASADNGMVEFKLENGLLVSEPAGGEVWNPRLSGATVLGLRQYNRYQTYESDDKFIDGELHAFELGLLYDNTDFPVNPSQGSSQYIAIHHDPGWSGSREEWTYAEFEASKYFSLGSSDLARQRIVALNFWTAYSPSWELELNEEGASKVVGGPPFLEGASLGGFYRMRGYRDSRFHDKASIYGSAEYRYTLDYNPVKNIDWLRFLHLDWFQLVAFAEAGRVAPEYKIDTLLSDVKTDLGVGIRAMTAGVIVRFDIAHSEEGTNFWFMVGHPF